MILVYISGFLEIITETKRKKIYWRKGKEKKVVRSWERDIENIGRNEGASHV